MQGQGFSPMVLLPASQVQGPEFDPRYKKKRKERKMQSTSKMALEGRGFSSVVSACLSQAQEPSSIPGPLPQKNLKEKTLEL